MVLQQTMKPSTTSDKPMRRSRRARHHDESGGILAVLAANQQQPTTVDKATSIPVKKMPKSDGLPQTIFFLPQRITLSKKEDEEEHDDMSEMTTEVGSARLSLTQTLTSPLSAMSKTASEQGEDSSSDENSSSSEKDDEQSIDESHESVDSLSAEEEETQEQDDDSSTTEEHTMNEVDAWKGGDKTLVGDTKDEDSEGEVSYDNDDEYEPDAEETEAENDEDDDQSEELELDDDDIRVTQKHADRSSTLTAFLQNDATATSSPGLVATTTPDDDAEFADGENEQESQDENFPFLESETDISRDDSDVEDIEEHPMNNHSGSISSANDSDEESVVVAQVLNDSFDETILEVEAVADSDDESLVENLEEENKPAIMSNAREVGDVETRSPSSREVSGKIQDASHQGPDGNSLESSVESGEIKHDKTTNNSFDSDNRELSIIDNQSIASIEPPARPSGSFVKDDVSSPETCLKQKSVENNLDSVENAPVESLEVSTIGVALDVDETELGAGETLSQTAAPSIDASNENEANNINELTSTVSRMALKIGNKMSVDAGATSEMHDESKPCTVIFQHTRSEGIVKQGQWTRGSRIGTGSFGVVHVGMNHRNGSLMAVKSIHMLPEIMTDIRREIDLLKSLKHVNIVRYYGAEINGSDLHIFQEWVAGGSVSDLLAKFGPFPFPVIQSYGEQMLCGLAFLHANSILHRDIKGSNLLVTNSGIIKLADFGGSKRLTEFHSDMMMSMTMRGTPYFMAPEVFEQKYSAKADVWAVGCVLYQMVTASVPWKTLGFNNPFSLCRHLQITEGPPALPRTIPASDGHTLNHFLSVLASCFHRNPFHRPDIGDLLQEPFFMEKEYFSDDEHSDSPGLFSPDVIRTRAARLSSPMRMTKTPGKSQLSPARRTPPRPRRNSIGPSGSPFLSPPLPKRQEAPRVEAQIYSPAKDTSDWPDWAKQRHNEAKNQDAKPPMMDSLAYSTDSAARTPDDPMRGSQGHSLLNGLAFLSLTTIDKASYDKDQE